MSDSETTDYSDTASDTASNTSMESEENTFTLDLKGEDATDFYDVLTRLCRRNEIHKLHNFDLPLLEESNLIRLIYACIERSNFTIANEIINNPHHDLSYLNDLEDYSLSYLFQDMAKTGRNYKLVLNHLLK